MKHKAVNQPEATPFVRAAEGAKDGLFKFRPYAGAQDGERVKELLMGSAYFSRLCDFNDPFEGRARFVSGDRDTFLERLRAHVERIERECGIKPQSPLANVDADEFVASMTKKNQERLRTEHRFFCLCATRAHPLLWSHYGDSHRGVCIQFASKSHPFGNALKIAYDEQFPGLEVVPSGGRNTVELLTKCLLTKAPYWLYEHEYRLVSVRDDNPTWHLDCKWSADKMTMFFDPRCITGLTLGVGIGASVEIEIREFLTKNRPDVRLQRAVLRDDRYELGFVDI